jgi:hypothetical protein
VSFRFTALLARGVTKRNTTVLVNILFVTPIIFDHLTCVWSLYVTHTQRATPNGSLTRLQGFMCYMLALHNSVTATFFVITTAKQISKCVGILYTCQKLFKKCTPVILLQTCQMIQLKGETRYTLTVVVTSNIFEFISLMMLKQFELQN